MKKYIFAALLLVAFACEENETSYSVAPELENYVTTFIAEAAERGVTIPTNNLIAETTTKAQAVANAHVIHGQNYIYASPAILNPSRAMEVRIFNELGSLFVKNKVVIIDLNTYEREAFFDELIK